ncbi:thiamine pyrophosphate-binding protein [Thermobifida halotolerans]|uniref:Thiamine pyrophosphate-binding protein n=1 Tax=Thermobifida halotolerans TaxID=483545 RepID=A0AA97LZY2_9ACTN|nr:thiamine pyrophosphate-binding protein [Thermobifida halotolerans]UOE21244.1 thiamine pyrophosphate-binding protein [Thermobifida halotolerans]
MLFHEVMARALADHGVDTVFGVLGDANLYMMDSFQRVTEGRYYSCSNEAGAVLAANGFARTSGRLGVATVTHGPALTNTATALVESVRDHTPLLLVAGDTAVVDRENFQNIPQRDVVLPTGAGFEQVRSPLTAAEDVATAIRRALLERRPVVLNVPVEFQWEDVPYQPAAPKLVEPQAVAPDPAALDAAVGVVAAARRPIVLAGRGAAAPRARAALLRLAERIGAPVATTLRGKDLFRGERCNLGIFGTLSHEVALETIMESDCVVAFGASLNKWTTAEGSLLEKKRIVHVDLDRDGINRFSHADVGVVGDAATVAETIVEWLDQAEVAPTGFASEGLAAKLAARSPADFTDRSTDETVDIRTAMLRIDEAFPADRTLVLDGGRFIFTAFTMLHCPEPSAYVHTVNFGSIGLGMGNAIGACLGAPGRPTLLVTGDGGFMLGGLAEFNTAVRHGVDLVVVVLNDGAYGAEHVQFRAKNMDPAISTFAWPDFGPVATALGGRGFTVRNPAELDEALAAVETRDRPILIEIRIDPDRVPAPGH